MIELTKADSLQSDPIAWESSSAGFKRYITQATYEKMKPAIQRWYQPYKCATCKEGLQVEDEPFQTRVGAWMDQCFVPSLYSNMVERGDRLLEEVLELLQAHGYDRSRVGTLVDYVYGRPVGNPGQEVGGVMITLAGFCYIAGLDMHAEGQRELARISKPDVMAKIRAKQESKNALHFDSPLPGVAAEYPQCSGDPASCPEKEGYGCCKPNTQSEAK
jgi:hypothetical protein